MVTVRLFPRSRAALNFDKSLTVNSYLIWHILSWNELILIKTKIYFKKIEWIKWTMDIVNNPLITKSICIIFIVFPLW